MATESHIHGKPMGTSAISAGKVARSHLVDVPGITKDTELQILRPMTRTEERCFDDKRLRMKGPMEYGLYRISEDR